MTAGERAKALKYLEESRAEFLAAIDGVSDAQWKWKPAPAKWSVGECAEHIVMSEGDDVGEDSGSAGVAGERGVGDSRPRARRKSLSR